MKDRFSRLLGACELLAREETAALVRRDFTALGKTQQVKSVLLADLAAQANLLHASCDSHARTRLTQLLECNRENSRMLAGMKAEVAEQLRKVRAAGNQLHALRAAYTPGGTPGRRAFSAHG